MSWKERVAFPKVHHQLARAFLDAFPYLELPLLLLEPSSLFLVHLLNIDDSRASILVMFDPLPLLAAL